MAESRSKIFVACLDIFFETEQEESNNADPAIANNLQLNFLKAQHGCCDLRFVQFSIAG